MCWISTLYSINLHLYKKGQWFHIFPWKNVQRISNSCERNKQLQNRRKICLSLFMVHPSYSSTKNVSKWTNRRFQISNRFEDSCVLVLFRLNNSRFCKSRFKCVLWSSISFILRKTLQHSLRERSTAFQIFPLWFW